MNYDHDMKLINIDLRKQLFIRNFMFDECAQPFFVKLR